MFALLGFNTVAGKKTSLFYAGTETFTKEQVKESAQAFSDFIKTKPSYRNVIKGGVGWGINPDATEGTSWPSERCIHINLQSYADLQSLLQMPVPPMLKDRPIWLQVTGVVRAGPAK